MHHKGHGYSPHRHCQKDIALAKQICVAEKRRWDFKL